MHCSRSIQRKWPGRLRRYTPGGSSGLSGRSLGSLGKAGVMCCHERTRMHSDLLEGSLMHLHWATCIFIYVYIHIHAISGCYVFHYACLYLFHIYIYTCVYLYLYGPKRDCMHIDLRVFYEANIPETENCVSHQSGPRGGHEGLALSGPAFRAQGLRAGPSGPRAAHEGRAHQAPAH